MHRHLNPVIADAIAITLGILVGLALLYGMFSCNLVNFPELMRG